VSVISGPPGPRPESVFDAVGGPLLLLWGEDDTVTPLDGPVARFLRAAADVRPDTEFVVLPGERWPWGPDCGPRVRCFNACPGCPGLEQADRGADHAVLKGL
jgi:hypothetical protein